MTPTQQAIIDALQAGPMTQGELCSLLALSDTWVRKAVNELATTGAVSIKKRGTSKLVSLASKPELKPDRKAVIAVPIRREGVELVQRHLVPGWIVAVYDEVL